MYEKNSLGYCCRLCKRDKRILVFLCFTVTINIRRSIIIVAIVAIILLLELLYNNYNFEKKAVVVK